MSHLYLSTLKIRECSCFIKPNSETFWKNAASKVAHKWRWGNFFKRKGKETVMRFPVAPLPPSFPHVSPPAPPPQLVPFSPINWMPSTPPPASGTHAFIQPRKLLAREFLTAVFRLKVSLSSTHGGLGYATWLWRVWNSFQTSFLCPLEQGSDFSGTDLQSAGQHTVATTESHGQLFRGL